MTRRLGRDCRVAFDGQNCAVPLPYVDRQVKVQSCADVVQIWAELRVLKEYPGGARSGSLWIDFDCFEGEATEPGASSG